MKRLGILGFVLLFAAPAFAVDDCYYEIYRPENVAREVVRSLPDLDIAKIGPEFPIDGVTAGRTNLIRGQQVVAQIETVEDVVHSLKRWTVYDVKGQRLLDVAERAYPCPQDDPIGTCKEITINTLRDASFKGPAFTVLVSPDRPIKYVRYARPVGWYDFRTGLWDSIQWLRETLVKTTDTEHIDATTLEEKIFWAIAADPIVAPYLGRLTITVRPDRPHISGVVPSNQVWDLILIRARAAGVKYLAPDMKIDGRTFIDPGPDFPRLGRCLP